MNTNKRTPTARAMAIAKQIQLGIGSGLSGREIVHSINPNTVITQNGLGNDILRVALSMGAKPTPTKK